MKRISYRLTIIGLGLACWQALSVGAEREIPPYEIIAHRAAIRIDPSASVIACTDTVTIRRWKSTPDPLTLNLLQIYTVRSAAIDGREVEYSRAREKLQFSALPSDSVFDVVLSYSTRTSFRTEFTALSSERAVLREEDVLVYGSRLLRFVRLTVHVPPDWECITGGALVGHSTDERSATFVWEMRETVPLIGGICAGRFLKAADSQGTPPITAYVFEEDSAAVQRALAIARSAVGFYSATFSPYRFSKLAIVEVEDWVGGPTVLGIAAPSFVMIKKLAFITDDTFNRLESILPHEIAHQWWPATVFVENVDLPFLAEGMCEYSSILFHESTGQFTRRDSLNNHPFLRPLMMRLQQGKDVPLHQPADLRTLYTQYLKASYVHNMLRRLVGDKAFLELYHTFGERFATRFADLQAFQDLAEEVSGKKLGWFFDQWVRRTGVPRLKLYNVKFARQGDGWEVSGRVRIVGYEKYQTLATVGVELSKGMVKTQVWLGTDSSGSYRNDMPFLVSVRDTPRRVILDPDGDVLKLQRLPAKFANLRDPSDGLFIFGTRGKTDFLMSLARTDSSELARAGWTISLKADTSTTLGDLQNEMVFVYGGIDENTVAGRQAGRFPMVVESDSIEINGQVLSDSTLTLYQTIENPFNAQGLFNWVVPFSRHATSTLGMYDASWVLMRGKDEIASGTWSDPDPDLIVERR